MRHGMCLKVSLVFPMLFSPQPAQLITQKRFEIVHDMEVLITKAFYLFIFKHTFAELFKVQVYMYCVKLSYLIVMHVKTTYFNID